MSRGSRHSGVGHRLVTLRPHVQITEEGNNVHLDQVEAHRKQRHTDQYVRRRHHHRYVLHASGCEAAEADGDQAEEAEVPAVQQSPFFDDVENERTSCDIGDQDDSCQPDGYADGLPIEETRFVTVGHCARDYGFGARGCVGDESVDTTEGVG